MTLTAKEAFDLTTSSEKVSYFSQIIDQEITKAASESKIEIAFHMTNIWDDYCRFTVTSLRELYERNGFIFDIRKLSEIDYKVYVSWRNK